MSLFRTSLRSSVFRTNVVYHAQKNKQKYTQHQSGVLLKMGRLNENGCKRQFHTTPPNPPDKPIGVVLFLMASYYIYQNTPSGPPPPSHFGLY